MNVMTVEHLTHSYTERLLFDDAAFSLDERDKVGIIGINGTGKSTLLRILAGKEEADNSNITRQRDLRITYLPQLPVFPEGFTALHAALPLPEEISGDPADYIPEAKSNMQKLGLPNYEQPISELSGGQRKRLALIRTLLSPADLLILDEPTNHLDSAMAEWLEQELKKDSRPLIMITHDRYFLDSVTNRIVEIDKGKLYSYQGNYLTYLQLKAEREEIARASERKRQSLLRTEIAWMMRGARARSTKQKAHIARYEALRDQSAPVQDEQIQISSVVSRLGKSTIELEHISKSYNGHPLILDFSYIFLRDDRIGIIGPNGCGKSTLLKMILDQIKPDQGSIHIGQTVRIGYFSQENEEMEPSLRVIDYIKEVGEYLHTTDGLLSASAMLERFLFPPDQQYTRIEKLSGGERRRLYLLRVLMAEPNVLFLDEPTNDLDITTLTILEDYLDQFPGIIVTISHDRYFLDRIVNRIFAFEGQGILKQYEGAYSDYLEHSQAQMQLTDAGIGISDVAAKKNSSGQNRNNWKEGQKRQKKKMSYQEQKDFESIEAEIAELEDKLEKVEQDILAYSRDFIKLGELQAEKDSLSQTLDEKMERWMYLEELAAELNGEK